MGEMSVLIVETSTDVAKELESVLKEYRLFEQFLVATTSDEAISIGRSHRPVLIIYDLPLADSFDAEAISELRVLLPKTGIIAISLYETYRSAALAAGAHDFVVTTAPRTAFLEAVDRVCPLAARSP